MSNDTLSDAQARALRLYRDAAKRASLAACPNEPTVDTVCAWLPSARVALRDARRTTEQSVAEATAQIESGRAGVGGDSAAWKRLEGACRRLEQELTAPSTLRARLDEGRRSMMPRIERVIQERLEPTIIEKGGRLVAELEPTALEALTEELPRWVEAWSDYTYRWIEHDRRMLCAQLWHPKEADLPLEPPRFTPLDPPSFKASITFPQITMHRDQKSAVSGVLTRGRSLLYGLLSVTFLFGIERSGKTSGADGLERFIWPALLTIGCVLAVLVGVTQTRAERTAERERLSEAARSKASQAFRETLRTWLDRQQDKIGQDLRDQLVGRRQQFVEWFRNRVQPAQARREAEAVLGQRVAEGARKRMPQLQEQTRNLGRVTDALQALAKTMGTQA